MTETKFTPGPWVAFKGAGWCVSRPNAKMAHMVGMHANFSLVAAESNDEEEAEANARLISAAPDLYQALENVMAEIACLGDEIQYFGTTDPFDAARAALAKARGKS